MGNKLVKTIILLLSVCCLTGCGNTGNATNESKNVKKTKIQDEIYYVYNKTYNGEFHIDEIYSNRFNRHDEELEVSEDGIVYDYYNFKDKGKIMTYEEYVNYCKSYKTEPYYTDENSNYLIVSYGNGFSYTLVELIDVLETENSAKIYLWDDFYGIMGEGTAYILAIPTQLSVDANIEVIPCISKEEQNNLLFYGYFENPNGMLDKPVIYLYPTETTNVDVKLELDGELTCTYPLYKNGWSITANPDGTLIDTNNQTYNYLYWEGISDEEWNFDKGFCVKGTDTIAFLEDILPKLGLNRKEANEFIIYWLPQMQNNEYNLISFQFENYENNAKLSVNPNPDTTIRVFMAWKTIDKEIEIEPQKFNTPIRNGFTLVEWGGTKVCN